MFHCYYSDGDCNGNKELRDGVGIIVANKLNSLGSNVGILRLIIRINFTTTIIEMTQSPYLFNHSFVVRLHQDPNGNIYDRDNSMTIINTI